MMTDRFEAHAAGLDAPASHGFAVTPHDSTLLVETTRALYVGSAGHVALVLASGASVTLANVAGGTVLPVRAVQVRATGTTASNLVALL